MSDVDLGSNLDAPVKVVKAKAPADKPARVKIILEENEHIPAGGLFLGLNGYPYYLKPGVEADVPTGLVEILDNAIESKPIICPDTKRNIGWRDSRRFPYRKV